VYKEVHEDSRIESTHKLPSEVEFRKRSIKYLAYILIIIIIDQYSKFAAFNFLTSLPYKTYKVNDFFNLVTAWNKGISFGMFNNSLYSNIIFLALASSIVLYLIMLLYKSTSKFTSSALSLIIGGAIGNIIDRLRFKAVADFIEWHIGSYYWPAFNIADAAICLGVTLLIIDSIINKKDRIV
jgi:signal peptidase II